MSSMFRDRDGHSYLVPFILVTSLFFLWGVAHSILDVLNKHFQDVLVISKARSGLVQAMVYGGYFLMALPAGRIIRKWGYRTGIVTGLLLYGVGALMFIPGGKIMSFPFFLLCLFIIGCGLTCLETSANPYMTVLGERDSAARRLNLAQSFNGLGWIVGPLAGGLLILGDDSNLSLPYAVIGAVVIVMGLVFSRIKLPSPESDSDLHNEGEGYPGRNGKSIWSVRSFRYGVPALLLYVAAQTGINSFFINYVTESAPIQAQTAALMLSFGGMGLFMTGRLLGSALMRKVRPATMMTGMLHRCSRMHDGYDIVQRHIRNCGLMPDIPVREHHVSDHIFHVPLGIARGTDQDGIIIPHYVDCGGSHCSSTYGTYGRGKNVRRVHTATCMFHRNSRLFNVIQ